MIFILTVILMVLNILVNSMYFLNSPNSQYVPLVLVAILNLVLIFDAWIYLDPQQLFLERYRMILVSISMTPLVLIIFGMTSQPIICLIFLLIALYLSLRLQPELQPHHWLKWSSCLYFLLTVGFVLYWLFFFQSPIYQPVPSIVSLMIMSIQPLLPVIGYFADQSSHISLQQPSELYQTPHH